MDCSGKGAAILALLEAAGAECLGLHSFLGAFLVGIALFDVYRRTLLPFDVIGEFSSAIFTPVSFVSMAIGADFIAIPEDKRIVRHPACAPGGPGGTVTWLMDRSATGKCLWQCHRPGCPLEAMWTDFRRRQRHGFSTNR